MHTIITAEHRKNEIGAKQDKNAKLISLRTSDSFTETIRH